MAPPSGLPVKEAILDDIASTLSAIVAGDDYYTTVERVQRIDATPMELSMFPAVVIIPQTTDYDREATQGTLTIAAEFRIQLALMLRTRTDAVSKLERFIRDVHKALLLDRYRGGLALNTRVVEDEVFYPTEDDEAFSFANVIVEVDYRTRWNDLNAST
jgi:hypothetical protein